MHSNALVADQSQMFLQELTAKFEQEKAEATAKLEEFKQQATAQEDLLRGYLRTSEGRVESLTRCAHRKIYCGFHLVCYIESLAESGCTSIT